MPQTIEGESLPGLATIPAHRLPSSPVIILREGELRGARIAVVAFTPIFADDGETRVVTKLNVTLPDATPLHVSAGELLARVPRPGTAPPGPTNPVASKPAVKLRVAYQGIQRVSGIALAAAGMKLSTVDPARLQLWHSGVAVALEIRGADDGFLDADDELRFYAPPPGDRWNATDTYWLTQETGDGLRMATVPPPSSTAPITTTASQAGIWLHNTVYSSVLPGPDGDHWYSFDMRTGPGQVPFVVTVPMTAGVPIAPGVAAITVTGSAYTSDLHRLVVETESFSQTLTWSGVGDWTRTFTTTDRAESLRLILAPRSANDGVLLDSVAWERRIGLDTGGKGMIFDSLPETWRYQITGTLPGQALYDVSDPDRPASVSIPEGAPWLFESVPGKRYVVTGSGTLHTPEAVRHTPIALSAPLNADALYISPAAFKSALAPLVSYRLSQGHAVQIVDVQAIYDAWSFGQMAPRAIRDFLRYAAATWTLTPRAVTLVGDGTSDPLNYTGRNNTSFIPPYLAMVDPWLGETACDTCYGQLDGDDALDDPLPDLMVGRLPVKSASETATVVAKIVDYETAGPDAATNWRARAVYVADNLRNADGSIDEGGDFAAFADASAALQPSWMAVERLYYDPSPSHEDVPWREPDAVTAYRRTLALLNAGAGLVNYVGHAHHWQWAVTDLTASPSYLMGLYDVDTLTNRKRLPILLEMTCLTSAFQQPAYSGTTIDERFLLHGGGGAVAIWGPTGLGLSHGHDALQRGFYTALWAVPPTQAVIGELVTGGYLELFANDASNQDALRTFVLLGDPLTRARIFASKPIYLPMVR